MAYRTLGELGEFGLIDRIAALAHGGRSPALVLGIGDDAALLRLRSNEDVAVTTDSLVEGVHFDLAGESPGNVGRRALLANLSDLAAMGARPLGFTLAFAAPPALPVAIAVGLLRGMLAVAVGEGCPLVGGNVTRAREVSLAIGVTGAVRRGRALRRAGARPGDRLLVTGSLGGAALTRARALLPGGRRRGVPPCRIQAGRALARTRGVHACIDVSDGLLADLRHLLTASGVGADLDLARVPRPRGFGGACRRLGLDPDRLALTGGEDYELLFAVGPGVPGAAVLARRLGAPATEIGCVTRSGAGRLRGIPEGLDSEGWRHF